MNKLTAARYSVPVVFIIGSIIYGVLIFNLPLASLGEPSLPKYFPGFVCAGIFIFSVLDLIKVKQENYFENEDLKLMVDSKSVKLVLIILAICLGYTLTFEVLGYLLSTILFIGSLLFYLNGLKKWKMNIIVTVIVSFSTWYSFTELLGITLP